MSDSIRLLGEIRAFAKTAKMAESTVGAKAVNDGKLAARLAAGASVTTRTADKVRAFIRKNRPRRRGGK
jgi:hypothetical protein